MHGGIAMHGSDLAASVASRICHDLVSPVGAVVNGVDLVRETGGPAWSEAVGMIGQSAGRASSLLQLYRIAFGAAEAGAAPVSRGMLAGLAAVLAQPPRIALEWQGRDGPPLARAEARLVALLLLCARSVTGMRGTIRLSTGGGSAMPLALEVESESFAATVDMLDMLEGGPSAEPVSPRTVEFVLAARAAREMKVRLSVERAEGRVAIHAAAMG